MVTMTALQVPGPYTAADLAALPDDGHRHELVDGTLVVTPAPSDPHQAAVGELYLLLRTACPPHLRVRFAPYDVMLADDTVMQPDLLVCRRSEITRRGLPAAPLLVVEVMSPSTQDIDRNLKKVRYQAAGVPSYWLVDTDEPNLTVHELQDGRYVEVARVSGDDEWSAEAPYPVTLRPSDLLD